MSLAEAVLAIAEEMEKESEFHKINNSSVSSLVKAFAKQLRIAVKASASVPTIAVESASMFTPRTKEDGFAFQEKGSPQMLFVSGGPADGTFIAVDSAMSVGDVVAIMDGWYRRTKNCLIHVREETDKQKQS